MKVSQINYCNKPACSKSPQNTEPHSWQIKEIGDTWSTYRCTHCGLINCVDMEDEIALEKFIPIEHNWKLHKALVHTNPELDTSTFKCTKCGLKGVFSATHKTD